MKQNDSERTYVHISELCEKEMYNKTNFEHQNDLLFRKKSFHPIDILSLN